MAKLWDYKFNSSDGPVSFDSQSAADELDIIELGYSTMMAMACENDYEPMFALAIIHARGRRATFCLDVMEKV